MSDFNPLAHFPGFYYHPVIMRIATEPRWTISHPEQKMPIDVYKAVYQNKIAGASYSPDREGDGTLVTLPELIKHIPDAVNHAYKLDALRDHLLVLDIEPSCPDDIKAEMLKMPYLYGERSMSGKGYHLVFELPDCFDEYPIAKQKIVLKGPQKHYEILLDHYVTFTRDMLPAASGSVSFEPLFRNLCAQQTETIRNDFHMDVIKPEDIPSYDSIVGALSHAAYKKTAADFDDDESRYEYAFTAFIHRKLRDVLQTVGYIRNNGHAYTESEITWIVYAVTAERLTYRAKHDESRNGMPWLLYLAREAVAKFDESKIEKKKAKAAAQQKGDTND